jgi:hypothetical protein
VARENSTFEPDIVTGEQFFARAKVASAVGPKALMAAVLEDALETYRDYASSPNLTKRRLSVEAKAWIDDRESTDLFGFENVCRTLDIDPDWIRLRLRRLEEREAA